jgi:hypothetical protein
MLRASFHKSAASIPGDSSRFNPLGSFSELIGLKRQRGMARMGFDRQVRPGNI